jgi:hypothetical protein
MRIPTIEESDPDDSDEDPGVPLRVQGMRAKNVRIGTKRGMSRRKTIQSLVVSGTDVRVSPRRPKAKSKWATNKSLPTRRSPSRTWPPNLLPLLSNKLPHRHK